MTEALECAKTANVKIAVNQLGYNLLFRSIEKEVLPFCIKNNI